VEKKVVDRGLQERLGKYSTPGLYGEKEEIVERKNSFGESSGNEERTVERKGITRLGVEGLGGESTTASWELSEFQEKEKQIQNRLLKGTR